MERFGEVVRKLRKKKGWTLEEVGRRARLQKGYLSGIEQGSVNPPVAVKVIRLARVLGGDEQDLLLRAVVEKAPREIREELKRRVFGDEDVAAEMARDLAGAKRSEAGRRLGQAIGILQEVFGEVFPEKPLRRPKPGQTRGPGAGGPP